MLILEISLKKLLKEKILTNNIKRNMCYYTIHENYRLLIIIFNDD